MIHRLSSRTLSLALAPALAGLLLGALPASCPAQGTGFHVSPTTGLESVGSKETAPKPKRPEAPERKPGTVINAEDETSFDEKTRIAVFLGTVVVKDPQFDLTCDKLTAYLKKETPAAATAPVAAVVPAATPVLASATGKSVGKKGAKAAKNAEPGKGAEPATGGGLDRAVAEGHVVIVQDHRDETSGAITHYVGKGERADYEAATGELRLSGWPQIQQGVNNQVATAERTIMIMTREGRLKTIGPSKSVIVDQSELKGEKTGKAETTPKPEEKKP